MTYLGSLPADSALLEVFRAYPHVARPLLALHEEVMRADSALTPGERELIAAYVSALNECRYCRGAHSAAAEAFGTDPDLLNALVTDLGSAPVSARMRTLLGYLRTLTLEPARLSDADAGVVFASGWDERALHDAVMVCALFNCMNRIVEGLGIKASPEYLRMSGGRLHDLGYAGLGSLILAVDG
jgi:uncharacterized peroxidase-related enzyme